MRIFPRAALAAVFAFLCLPAFAADVPSPVPFDTALPTRKGECISSQEMQQSLQGVIQSYGGAGMAIEGERAQAFADAWRDLAGLPHINVVAGYGWITGSMTYGEIGANGCLITFTEFSDTQVQAVLKKMMPAEPLKDTKPLDPTVAPEGLQLKPNEYGQRNV